jgi:hypothetical protein
VRSIYVLWHDKDPGGQKTVSDRVWDCAVNILKQNTRTVSHTAEETTSMEVHRSFLLLIHPALDTNVVHPLRCAAAPAMVHKIYQKDIVDAQFKYIFVISVFQWRQ